MQGKKRVIVFFIPPEKIINGGILSIFSLCEVSREFNDIHKSKVVLCTYPGYKSYGKNNLFKNNEIIYEFEELLNNNSLEYLQLHVPEYASNEVFWGLKKYETQIRKINQLSVNIMNQNILLMKRPGEVVRWFYWTKDLTQTTAHDRYATQEIADMYRTPLRHLSTFFDKSQYYYKNFNKKNNLIILSPDYSNKKTEVVNKLKSSFPNYEFVTIEKMKFETYKKLISRAKYTITFGEGLDGYYLGAIFSGGIAFSVYNESFFPNKTFSKLKNIFADEKTMVSEIIKILQELDDKTLYERVVKENAKEINKLYNFKNYKNNIRQFYLHNFSFVPKNKVDTETIKDMVDEYERVIDQRDSFIVEKNKVIKNLEDIILKKDEIITARDAHIGKIENSHSWRVTKPLRKVVDFIKHKKG